MPGGVPNLQSLKATWRPGCNDKANRFLPAPRRRSSSGKGHALILIAALGMSCQAHAWASTPEVIYSFMGDNDGEYTDTDLAIDSQRILYGTSVQGGDFGAGTVFMLSPTGNGWDRQTLLFLTHLEHFQDWLCQQVSDAIGRLLHEKRLSAQPRSAERQTMFTARICAALPRSHDRRASCPCSREAPLCAHTDPGDTPSP